MERSAAGVNTNSHDDHHHHGSACFPAYEVESHIVKKQQSVRFAGPTAVQHRQSSSKRANNNSTESQANAATHRPRALTNNDSVPAAYRPPSRSSSIGKASVGKGTAENFVAALAAYDEYYTREDDVASTPSSYRRVRKSKSMISGTRRPHSAIFNNGTPDHDHRSSLKTLSLPHQDQHSQPELRAPKSMGFLRGERARLKAPACGNHDVAVQVARDKFLYQIEQQRLREQPSFLFHSKTRRQERQFRQSLRDSSTNSYGMPVASANQVLGGSKEGERSFTYKARKASKTIKNKIKSIFKWGDADASKEILPVQQVDSQKEYAAAFVGSATTLHEGYFDIPHPGQVTVSRVTSRVPSLHAVPSNQHLRSRTGSLQSLKSQDSVKSRVTSWTNSAADNTTTSRHAQVERELQRLSIIQENGTHVSSTSLAHQSWDCQFSGHPSLHPPRSATSRPTPITGSVDSQKVYSVSMQRLDENSPEVNLSVQRMASVGNFQPPTPVPPRSSSRNTHHSQTPATIRQIDKNSSEILVPTIYPDKETLATCPQEKDDVFASKTSSEPTGSVKDPRQQNDSSTNSGTVAVKKKTSYTAYPRGEIGDQPFLTPQLIADRNEGLPPKRGLTESRSTFFGHTGFTINRTTSPYRRALAEADYNSTVVTEDTPVGPSPLGYTLVMGKSSDAKNRSGLQDSPKVAYTESIYSRTTSGRTPPFTNSTATLLLVRKDDVAVGSTESADIVNRATYCPTLPNHGLSQSPADLRVWMSAQVATLQKQNDSAGTIKVNYALPTMPNSFGHHIRERAQIASDDADITQQTTSQIDQPFRPVQQIRTRLTDNYAGIAGRKFSLARQPTDVIQQTVHNQISDECLESYMRTGGHLKQPLSLIQQNIPQTSQQASLKPILKNQPSAAQIKIPNPPPLPPPMPSRPPLRATTSRSSFRSVRTIISDRTGSAPASGAKSPKKQHGHPIQTRLIDTIYSSTPGKLAKKNGRSVTHTPSPGLGTEANKQFGSANSRNPHSLSAGSKTLYSTPYGGTENQVPPNSGIFQDEQHESHIAGLSGPELEPKTMGNRRMVDLFLSSRRRRMAGSDESNAFL